MTENLFPNFEMNAFKPPSWFKRQGLGKYKPLVTMLRSSWQHWAQAEQDGLKHLSPIIMIYNAPPAEIKAKVGGHVWQELRTSNVSTNTNRMILRLLGAWSMAEAMEWPKNEKRQAKTFLGWMGKSSLLIACRHTGPGETIMENYTIAQDFVRMGGDLDPTWGRKRLKREHDTLAIQKLLIESDPTPWAKSWFCDVDGYAFTLLKSASELAIEGVSQKHCCRSYAEACRKGHETVFSIQGPERATASWNSKAKSLQVQGFANRAVLPATRQAAKACHTQYAAHLKELREKAKSQ